MASDPMWLRRDWRRSLLALVFAAAGMALTVMAAGLVAAVLAPAWPPGLAAARLRIIGGALYAVLGLLALVLTGLAMTVALRQVSARFMGADFSASGGDASNGAPLDAEASSALLDAGTGPGGVP